MISIILPVLNELRHGYLTRVLESIKSQQGEFELIVVDSNSTDETLHTCEPFADDILQAGECNRAVRMNKGAEVASGDILLFHHPRSILPTGALRAIKEALEGPKTVGGGFTHSFDHSQWNLSFTSWYSNKVRAKRGIIYLDHCLFVRSSVFDEIGGFPDIDIFEDTIFPKEMKKRGELVILPNKVVTSATRFKQRGIAKQVAVNQLLKLGFNLGMSPDTLNRLYEGKNPLNRRYKP